MATKKKKSAPKCPLCKKPRIDPKDFSASINGKRICVGCALKMVLM